MLEECYPRKKLHYIVTGVYSSVELQDYSYISLQDSYSSVREVLSLTVHSNKEVFPLSDYILSRECYSSVRKVLPLTVVAT